MSDRYIIKEHVCQLVSVDRKTPPKTLKGYHLIDKTTGQKLAASANRAQLESYATLLAHGPLKVIK